MSSPRARRLRRAGALGAVVLLAAGLVYTSFTAATQAATPGQVLASASPGRSYELTGKVVGGSVKREGEVLRFTLRDRDGSASIPVAYSGVVPDPFREGREVIISGEVREGRLVAERDSLVTKCPSKFSKA